MYVFRLKLCSYDHRLLDQSLMQIIKIVEDAGAKVSGPVPLPVRRRIFTVLRSTHIHKDAREQFEMRTHKRLLDIIYQESNVIYQLESYILPSGVSIETKLLQ